MLFVWLYHFVVTNNLYHNVLANICTVQYPLFESNFKNSKFNLTFPTSNDAFQYRIIIANLLRKDQCDIGFLITSTNHTDIGTGNNSTSCKCLIKNTNIFIDYFNPSDKYVKFATNSSSIQSGKTYILWIDCGNSWGWGNSFRGTFITPKQNVTCPTGYTINQVFGYVEVIFDRDPTKSSDNTLYIIKIYIHNKCILSLEIDCIECFVSIEYDELFKDCHSNQKFKYLTVDNKVSFITSYPFIGGNYSAQLIVNFNEPKLINCTSQYFIYNPRIICLYNVNLACMIICSMNTIQFIINIFLVSIRIKYKKKFKEIRESLQFKKQPPPTDMESQINTMLQLNKAIEESHTPYLYEDTRSYKMRDDDDDAPKRKSTWRKSTRASHLYGQFKQYRTPDDEDFA